MNDKPESVTESELAERSKAPRVTEADVLASIAKTDFIVHADSCLTICVLTLQNGFNVTGEAACADPKNYKQDIGERISKENAIKKIWVLLGYQLKERLFKAGLASNFIERMRNENHEVRVRLNGLIDFIDNNPVFKDIEETKQHLLIDQRDAMQKYVDILNQRIILETNS